MSVLEARDLSAAVEILEKVCRYDCMRLALYRQEENLASRIAIARVGPATALRFEDVGYFNRVYCADPAVFELLPELEEFYRGSPFGCELVGPPDEDGGDRPIRRAGWTPATRFAWLYGETGALAAAPPGVFEIREPEPSHRQQYLLTYLEAFGAAEDRIPGALRNMRHLFGRPELDFLLAWRGEEPAGVGMTMRAEGAALLCAGGARPGFREMGCHAALLGARIRLARQRRCDRVFSWAVLGGRSQSNMERAGLSMAGTTTCWRFLPEDAR